MSAPSMAEAQLENCRAKDAAAKVAINSAGQSAKAAKLAMNNAGQSAKVAMNAASHSMMSAFNRTSCSWTRKLSIDESLGRCSISSESLLNKLPRWLSNSSESERPMIPEASDVADLRFGSKSTEAEDDGASSPMSEVSTTASFSCQANSRRFSSDADLQTPSDAEWSPPFSEASAAACPPDSVGDRCQIWRLWFVETEAEVGDVEELQSGTPDEAARQIDLDVPRTHAGQLCEADRAVLRRVLRAYATHDPAVGYCQGMSSIAAVFVLLGFEEGAALHGLCSIVKGCCPDYFCSTLRGYVRDVAVLGVLVRETLPAETAQVLDGLDMPLHMLAADHFLTLASHTWPLEAVSRLWDLFLLEGSPAVFASFIVLLQLYLPQDNGGTAPSRREGPEQVGAFTKAVSKGVVDDLDTILQKTRELIPSIPMSKIDRLRYVFSG